MPAAPLQPIPESTQVHVDRLVGAQLGDLRVVARVGEGRHGTLYRAEPLSGGAAMTVQVLRAGVLGNDEEVRAANALKCEGIALATAFGSVDDGRRYRVFALPPAESLEQLIERRGRFAPGDAAEVLSQVAAVLETAHAWSVAHGSLGPSGVLRVGGAWKVIDFGLARERPTLDGDLRALGALGVALLAGQLTDDPVVALRTLSPGPLPALLRDLLDGRLPSATTARKDLQALAGHVTEPAGAAVTTSTQPVSAVAAAPGASRRGFLLAAVVALIAGAALLAWAVGTGRPDEPEAAGGSSAPSAVPVTSRDVDASSPPEPQAEISPALPSEPGARDAGADPLTPEADTTPTTEPRASEPRAANAGVRPPTGVPSARALQEEISRLEARLRLKARRGDDLDQALYVLNKQRLRLAGDPTVQDRQDVAKQLAGWRKSYLRR